MRCTAWVLVFLACAGEPPRRVRVHVPAGFDASALSWSPADALSHSSVEAGVFVADVSPTATVVRMQHPRACPLELRLTSTVTSGSLVEWLTVTDEQPQVGFGQTATVTARPGCPEARRGTISWVDERGAALELKNDGFVVRVPLEHIQALRASAPLHAEILPVSFAQRGRHTLVGTWQGPDHPSVTIQAIVNASTRVSGLPNLSVGQVAYLEGTAWQVKERPAGAHERLEPSDAGVTLFQADRLGRWVLSTGESPFSLQVGTFARTPLDCGRSTCHQAAAEAVRSSPMTSAYARRAQALPGQASCWRACHVVGEKGLRDEGFEDIARSFPEGVTPLPRALARATGVQCLNCHGSGRIPEPSARQAVLQVGVCATCHDAPPRYGHVVAWQGSRMALADVDPATRRPDCNGCHTTAGFLGREVNLASAPLGITCVACHAPHAAHGQHLLRQVPVPALLEGLEGGLDEVSLVCASCHVPRSSTLEPSNSAAAVVFGRGGLALSGGPLLGPSPHARLEGGCMACHRHAPAEAQLDAGSTHAFIARADECETCHAARGLPVVMAPPERPRTVSHATPRAIDVSTAQGRAQWNAALLAQDPAAWAHNPRYAAQLGVTTPVRPRRP